MTILSTAVVAPVTYCPVIPSTEVIRARGGDGEGAAPSGDDIE